MEIEVEGADALEAAAIAAAVTRYLSEDEGEDIVDPWVMSGRYAVAGYDEVRTPEGVRGLDEWVLSGRAERF